VPSNFLRRNEPQVRREARERASEPVERELRVAVDVLARDEP
jgi:hypothetical protein